ncbi:MAG TPA: hypothetical protein VHM92_11135 [Allosphingosinicella sp.]|nr:hypothetical protein [Allosphingosinicella sp.]
MRRSILALLLAAPAVAFSQAPPPLHVAPPQPRAEAPIVGEARMFMARYAQDLLEGRRAELAGRYDRRGAWRVGPSKVVFEPWSTIEANYARRWSAPSSFEWQDLVYEPAGPDAVTVIGRFLWGPGPDGRKPPVLFAYSALLVRQDGALRIRMEHESAAAEPAPRARRR